MRILHFLWGLAQGGAENLAIDLANEQCQTNQVTILVANEAIDLALAGRIDPSIQLVHLKRPEGSRNPLWIARLLAKIRAQRPDVVHSHAANLAILSPFISAPIVLTVHTTDVVLPKQAERLSAICCISHAVENDIRLRYPHVVPRLVVNGVKTSAISVRATAPSSPLRAVQVSRLAHETKGQDLLVEAIAILNFESIEPSITVDFIGSGASLEFLSELVHSKGLSDICKFVGPRSREEVFAQLQHYDLLVQPSREEGFGLTVVEGMAAGIPVVISDLPGPMEVIGNGQHGYHFRRDDPVSLATTIRTLITDIGSSVLTDRLLAARQFVIDEFDLKRTSDGYLQVYTEVINAC